MTSSTTGKATSVSSFSSSSTSASSEPTRTTVPTTEDPTVSTSEPSSPTPGDITSATVDMTSTGTTQTLQRTTSTGAMSSSQSPPRESTVPTTSTASTPTIEGSTSSRTTKSESSSSSTTGKSTSSSTTVTPTTSTPSPSPGTSSFGTSTMETTGSILPSTTQPVHSTTVAETTTTTGSQTTTNRESTSTSPSPSSARSSTSEASTPSSTVPSSRITVTAEMLTSNPFSLQAAISAASSSNKPPSSKGSTPSSFSGPSSGETTTFTLQSTSFESTSKATTKGTTSSPEDWRNCSTVCPEGYEEGDSYCYQIGPMYYGQTYNQAIGWCHKNWSVDLADETDFLNTKNLELFRKMRDPNATDLFWLNMHNSLESVKSLLRPLTSVTNTTQYHLAVQMVHLMTKMPGANALCRAPKSCAPLKCNTSQIYSALGYALPAKPAYYPDQFDVGMQFTVRCLGPASNNITTKCNNYGQWRPSISRLVCQGSASKPEMTTNTNKEIRQSCSECYEMGTASCVPVVGGGYKCRCKPGWTKFICWKSPNNCQPDTCNGRGTCIQMADQTTCKCDKLHAGPTCLIKLKETSLFGANNTVPIIFAGSVTAAMHGGTNYLLLALKALTKMVVVKECYDQLEFYQQVRQVCLAFGGGWLVFYGRPSVFCDNSFVGRVSFFIQQGCYLLAFYFYANEAVLTSWVISGKNKNEWWVDSKGVKKFVMSYGFTYCWPFLVVLGQWYAWSFFWKPMTNSWTTFGIWDSQSRDGALNAIIIQICVAVTECYHFVQAARGLLKDDGRQFLDLCYEAHLEGRPQHPLHHHQPARFGRVVVLPLPLLLGRQHLNRHSRRLPGRCLLLPLLQPEHDRSLLLLRVPPRQRRLPLPARLGMAAQTDSPEPSYKRRSGNTVRCAYKKKRLTSEDHPIVPRLDYWYLREEERYWMHRDMTRRYCLARNETGNTVEDCIQRIQEPELRRAMDRNDEEHIYWIGVWAEQVRLHDTFTIQRPRHRPANRREQVWMAMMAPFMTEGAVKREERQCRRYKALAELLGYMKVDKNCPVLPMSDRPWAPFPQCPVAPIFVLREQHEEALLYQKKSLGEYKIEEELWEELLDEKRPGFVGPHQEMDMRYLPGAREALDLDFRTNMKNLKAKSEKWEASKRLGSAEVENEAPSGNDELGHDEEANEMVDAENSDKKND